MTYILRSNYKSIKNVVSSSFCYLRLNLVEMGISYMPGGIRCCSQPLEWPARLDSMHKKCRRQQAQVNNTCTSGWIASITANTSINIYTGSNQLQQTDVMVAITTTRINQKRNTRMQKGQNRGRKQLDGKYGNARQHKGEGVVCFDWRLWGCVVMVWRYEYKMMINIRKVTRYAYTLIQMPSTMVSNDVLKTRLPGKDNQWKKTEPKEQDCPFLIL